MIEEKTEVPNRRRHVGPICKGSRQLDIGSNNPRMQCFECGRWMRLCTGKDKDGKAIQRFYGACEDGNDHPCGDNVCSDCCPEKCRQRLASLPTDLGGSLAESAD